MARPVIIDCDPGTDDAVALWLALASPELAVAAVTVSGGNVPLGRTTANATAIVALAGARAPVHAGASRPLLGAFAGAPRVHGADGLGGIALPAGAPADPLPAVDAIRAILRSAAAPVTLVGIAPLTNVALALASEPDLATGIEQIVLMSGAWAEGNVTPAAEFNAHADPEALAIVLAAGRPVVFATLELTAQALVTPARIARLRTRGNGACLRAAADILATLPASDRLCGKGAALHDPCAIAWLLAPDLFTTRRCTASVVLAGEARGRTLIDRSLSDRSGTSGRGADALLLETLDANRFFDLLGRRLARLP